MSRSHDAVSSAENTLVLVMALQEQGRLRVADAARLLSVTPPTAHRLLTILKRHEFAEQDRSRAYLAGPRLHGRRRRGAPLDVADRAGPHLVDLASRTRETVHLVKLEGNGCRFVDGPIGEQALRVASRIGLLLPAHLTAGGKVLLAHLPEADLLDLYPDRRVPLRDGTFRDLPSLRRELATVRRNGFALNLESSEQGVNGLGVPVTVGSGRVAASVVVAVPASRASRHQLLELVPVLRRTAKAVASAADVAVGPAPAASE